MIKEISEDRKPDGSVAAASASAAPDDDDVDAESNLNLDEDDDGGSTGYHSDSESAVMTSGNSPFISKEARYNFLSRSGEIIFIFCGRNTSKMVLE